MVLGVYISEFVDVLPAAGLDEWLLDVGLVVLGGGDFEVVFEEVECFVGFVVLPLESEYLLLLMLHKLYAIIKY